jgi:hypothetical protein
MYQNGPVPNWNSLPALPALPASPCTSLARFLRPRSH